MSRVPHVAPGAVLEHDAEHRLGGNHAPAAHNVRVPQLHQRGNLGPPPRDTAPAVGGNLDRHRGAAPRRAVGRPRGAGADPLLKLELVERDLEACGGKVPGRVGEGARLSSSNRETLKPSGSPSAGPAWLGFGSGLGLDP